MGRLEPSKDNSVVGSDATMAEGKIVNVTAIETICIKDFPFENDSVYFTHVWFPFSEDSRRSPSLPSFVVCSCSVSQAFHVGNIVGQPY